MKKLISLGMSLIIVLGFNASVFASQYITSWDFELYNKPYAESIALSLAQAQKRLEEDSDARWRQDPLERFEEMLTQQILYKLSRSVVDEIFGEGTLEPGTYTIGNYEIVVITDGITVTVTITDTETGDTTTIEVPYYNYGGEE